MEYSIDMVLVSYNNSNGSVIMLVAVETSFKAKGRFNPFVPKAPFPYPQKT